MLSPLEAFLQQFPVLLPLMPLFMLLLRVTIVLAVAFLALRLGTVLIIKLFSGKNSGLKLDTGKAKTLEALLKSVLRYAIYFFVAITVIEALHRKGGIFCANEAVCGRCARAKERASLRRRAMGSTTHGHGLSH